MEQAIEQLKEIKLQLWRIQNNNCDSLNPVIFELKEINRQSAELIRLQISATQQVLDLLAELARRMR